MPGKEDWGHVRDHVLLVLHAWSRNRPASTTTSGIWHGSCGSSRQLPISAIKGSTRDLFSQSVKVFHPNIIINTLNQDRSTCGRRLETDMVPRRGSGQSRPQVETSPDGRNSTQASHGSAQLYSGFRSSTQLFASASQLFAFLRSAWCRNHVQHGAD